jgi:hypothetical protein
MYPSLINVDKTSTILDTNVHSNLNFRMLHIHDEADEYVSASDAPGSDACIDHLIGCYSEEQCSKINSELQDAFEKSARSAEHAPLRAATTLTVNHSARTSLRAAELTEYVNAWDGIRDHFPKSASGQL